MDEFEGLILIDALTREWKLLEIVTAQEREANNRDGWALARIKVRALRRVLTQVYQAQRWMPGKGHGLHPDDEAALAERAAAIGQKMRPPRAELEKLMSVKARRRAAGRRIKPSNPRREAPDRQPIITDNDADAKPQRLRWATPAVGERHPEASENR